jgi:ubiquitin-conjugating enzyme E2 Q
MTRKAFNAAVEAAAKKSIPGVISVGKGEDDGHITILFTHASTPAIEIGLVALGKAGLLSFLPFCTTFCVVLCYSDATENI